MAVETAAARLRARVLTEAALCWLTLLPGRPAALVPAPRRATRRGGGQPLTPGPTEPPAAE